MIYLLFYNVIFFIQYIFLNDISGLFLNIIIIKVISIFFYFANVLMNIKLRNTSQTMNI